MGWFEKGKKWTKTVNRFTAGVSGGFLILLMLITAADIIATLFCLFISYIIAWQGWVVGIGEKTVSDMLRVPQYPFRLLVAVAAFLVGFELLIDLGDSLKKLVGRAS